jgi:outer membrane protein assembly factor BamA
LLLPAGLYADDQKPEVNINERYLVESVEFEGIDHSKISEDLWEEAQSFVGQNYNAQLANEFAEKLRERLKRRYAIDVRVNKGLKAEHVRVLFRIEKAPGVVTLKSTVKGLYHSKQGFSGLLEVAPFQDHFAVGIVSEADRLLERNAGYMIRFKQPTLGTDLLGFQIDFESYHQSFDDATIAELQERTDIPDFYRARQNFAPYLTFRPIQNLTLSAGLSFQRLQLQYPSLHTATAYAGTGDLRYSRDFPVQNGISQTITATYGLRTATNVLDSDYIYTRHFWKVDYKLSRNKNSFYAHFTGGIIGGTAPLFERFSLGNSTTLRGWNKFDVSPIGGSRVAHGSLEYRYRVLEVFYDVGAVWDPGKYNPVRHSFGFGLAFGKNSCVSLAFPVRLHDVSPIFMIGTRF